MNQNSWMYFIEVAICFSAFYGIYFLLFQNLTHHIVNRAVLLSSIFLSLIVPKLNLNLSAPIAKTINNKQFVLGDFDGVFESLNTNIEQSSIFQFDFLFIIKLIYFTGLVIFAYQFIYQIIRILIIRFSNTAKRLNKITLILINKNISPFSFFYWIFIPLQLHDKNQSLTIIEHEKVHAQQWHSLDLLIAELYGIIFWFVPFVYSFKKSLKNVHEFLADSSAIKKSNKIEYMKLLSLETEKYNLTGISSHFYSKTLKKRITMITKNKSPKYAKYLYLLLIPVLVILIQSFSTTQSLISSDPIAVKKTAIVERTNEVSFIQPIDSDKCKISSPFGKRIHPIYKTEHSHNGTDYKAEMGTPVKASSAGTIIKVEFIEGGYGKLIVIEHSQGFNTLYAQLSEFKCKIGDQVKQGQTIGLVGSSGRSTGPHLHFEIRKDGKHVNPVHYIK